MDPLSQQLHLRAKALTPGLLPSLLRGLGPFALCVVLAAILQAFIKPHLQAYTAKLVLDIGINVVLAVSLTMVNGFTGQFSMGHAGFLAVGGYASGIVSYYGSLRAFGDSDAVGGVLSGMPIRAPEGLPWLTQGDGLFVLALIAGGLVAAILGFLVGLPSLRLRGDYLAIVTLGFGEIVRVLITRTGPVMTPTNLNDPSHPLHGQLVVDVAQGQAQPLYVPASEIPWTEAMNGVGGALGFSGLPTYSSLFWVYLVVGITMLVAYRLKISTFGRAFLSIREDEIASEAMGVNTTRYKVWAFVISAFFAGIAGGLFAHTLGVGLTPQAAGFQKSFDIIIMVVLGGLGSVSGAAIAAIVVTLLPEYLRGIADYRMIVFALALVLIMIFRPQGLLGVREVWDKSLWSWLRASKRNHG